MVMLSWTSLRWRSGGGADSGSSVDLGGALVDVVAVTERAGPLAVAGKFSSDRRLESELVITENVLGSGASGEVHLGQNADGGELCAIKSMKKIGASARARRELKAEAEIHLSLEHPHIVRLKAVYETEDDLHFVTELLEGGELFDRVVNSPSSKLSEAEAANAVEQMLSATSYLHSRQVIHRDLKLENFVYERKGSRYLKLIDFGLAKRWDGRKHMNDLSGTLPYNAPEVLKRSYTTKADIWSMGVCTYMMLCGCCPWAPWKRDVDEMKKRIAEGMPFFDPDHFGKLSGSAQAFVRSLLTTDPVARPSAAIAIENPWIVCLSRPVLSLSDAVMRRLQVSATVFPLRRALLYTLVWTLPLQDQEPLREQFRIFDVDSKGVITLDNFQSVLGSRGIDDVVCEELFSKLDINSDGVLSYGEFLAAAAQPVEYSEDTLRQTFQAFDEDLRAALGSQLTGAQGLESSLLKRDGEDGAPISWQDFVTYLRESDEKTMRSPDWVERVAREHVEFEALMSCRASRAGGARSTSRGSSGAQSRSSSKGSHGSGFSSSRNPSGFFVDSQGESVENTSRHPEERRRKRDAFKESRIGRALCILGPGRGRAAGSRQRDAD